MTRALFHFAHDGKPLRAANAAEKNLDLLAEITRLRGIECNDYFCHFTRGQRRFGPCRGSAAARGAHVVNHERRGARIPESKGVRCGIALGEHTEIVLLGAEPFYLYIALAQCRKRSRCQE